MAALIRAIAAQGLSVYAHLRNAAGETWNGSAFESYDEANWAAYSIAMIEQTGSGYYSAAFPSSLPGGLYDFALYSTESSPASGDAPLAQGEIYWDGSAEEQGVGLAVAATPVTLAASQLQIKKNTALSNFMVLMVRSSDHATPAVGLSVTATRSIDGASFGACANSVSEVANGIYKINLAAADLNGTVVTLKFAAALADSRFVTMVTQA